MFVSLVKIKKYLINLFLFLFFSCFFSSSTKAASYDSVFYALPADKSTHARFLRGIDFDTDGDNMYISGDNVAQVGLNNGDFDITDVDETLDNMETPDDIAPQDIKFNNDGSKLFTAPHGTSVMRQYTLSTPWDVSTGTQSATYSLPNRAGSAAYGLEFNTDGTLMFTTDANGGNTSGPDEIDVYELSTGFDISTASYKTSLDITNNTKDPKSLVFNPDGTTLFILDGTSVDEYVFTTAFDITTATYVDTFSTGATNPHSLAFNTTTGLKLFVLENNRNVKQYSLPGKYNLNLPTLSSSSPADNATGVLIDANIVLNFSEPMDVESGNIKIYKTSDNSLVETIDVTSSQVTGTGTTAITINPSSDFEYNVEYYVLIDATAFDDGSDASYAGITSTTALSFTAANSAPTLVSSVPADDATDVAIDANIVLNFSESVNADDGDIVIYKTSGGTTVETIASTASNVTGSGTSQITINPSADFEYGIEYYVLIDSGAFDDDNDEDYTGITSTTALSFTVNNRVDPTTIKDVVGSMDAQSESAKNYISQSIDTVSNRLRYLRQNRLSDSLSSQNLQIDVGNTILTSLANDNLEKNTNSFLSNNWSAWSSGTISVVKIGDSTNSSLQETEGQGVALGFDKKLSDSDFIGFAIQYGQSDTDIGANGTSIDSENMNFSIYRTRPLDDNNFIETFLGVGLIESDLKRVHNSNILTGSRDGTQIFGSINFGKTIDRGDFNLTPIGRLDLGLTELDGYTETGTDALSYAKQRIENGLASFGFEFSDNIKLNENKLRPFGSLTFITNFSNSSDAKMNYVADTSTIYTYTHKANSDHLLSSMIGLTYIAGDYLNIHSSYSRVQGNSSEQRDTLDFAINFISNRETQYSLSLAGDENAEVKFGISKNIHSFNLGFNASESFSANPNQEAELMLTYNF